MRVALIVLSLLVSLFLQAQEPELWMPQTDSSSIGKCYQLCLQDSLQQQEATDFFSRKEVEKPVTRLDGGALIGLLQTRLKEEGYFDGPIDKQMTAELRAAITSFSRDKGLPVCGFTHPIFEALGIELEKEDSNE